MVGRSNITSNRRAPKERHPHIDKLINFRSRPACKNQTSRVEESLIISLQVNVRMVFLSVGMESHGVGVNQTDQTKSKIQFLPNGQFHLVRIIRKPRFLVWFVFYLKTESKTKLNHLYYITVYYKTELNRTV